LSNILTIYLAPLTSMYVTRSMSLYNLYSFWHNNILWG
jgi:hypothetical protein